MTKHVLVNYNVRGLLSKMAEFELLLMQLNPSVVAITDTQLNPTQRIYFRNYRLYRTDKVTGTAGGVALLVRRDIPSRQVDFPVIPTPGLHVVSVSIRLRHRHTVSCVYRRPRSLLIPAKLFLQEVIRDKHHIVVGDLNARHTIWADSTCNVLGRYIAKTGLAVYHPSVHTFRHAANAQWTSTIDLLLTME